MHRSLLPLMKTSWTSRATCVDLVWTTQGLPVELGIKKKKKKIVIINVIILGIKFTLFLS